MVQIFICKLNLENLDIYLFNLQMILRKYLFGGRIRVFIELDNKQFISRKL